MVLASDNNLLDIVIIDRIKSASLDILEWALYHYGGGMWLPNGLLGGWSTTEQTSSGCQVGSPE